MTTAHLAQTMTLLALSNQELQQKIESELASNPALELSEEIRCPNCHRILPARGVCPICGTPKNISSEEPIVFISPRSDFSPVSDRVGNHEEMPDHDWISVNESLPEYVLKQIATELAVEDRALAAHILNSLDEDGLLRVSSIEIARYHFVPVERVHQVIRQIQRADPLGVGSPSPQEALLVQLEILSENHPVPYKSKEAITEGMELLSRYAYAELGRLLKISAAEAENIANFISENLNPYPGRSHWGESASPSEMAQVYYDADIIINRLNSFPHTPLIVEIIAPYAGSLRVNPLFREALLNAPSDKSEHWQSDLESASLLIKCLQQRNQALVRLMQRLVILQRNFILEGDASLIPITRAQLAIELDVHESTISRAVAGKAVQLPNRRIIPLSKLFDRSLHIRTALLQIIENEASPLSDTQIAEILEKQGFSVARRTVAKYRAIEGVLPARMRRPQCTTNKELTRG
jgi:RNA polymerase sigma-54 factor